MITRRRLLISGGAVVGAAGLAGCGHKSANARNGRPRKEFGVATDPWRIDDWASAVGAKPTTVMEFESWDRNRGLDTHFAAARDKGLKSYVITWEPWQPVDVALGQAAEGKLQPAYANTAIAAGKQDDYIRMFATSVKQSKLTVYIRYAHEMTGGYYPWSHDPDAYITAWQRIVGIFRDAGATNAKFIFAPGESLYQPGDDRWLGQVKPYWPGSEHVDYVGTTMTNLGGEKTYSVGQFLPRLNMLRSTFGKEVFIAEMNSAAEGRVKFFTDLRTWLSRPEADFVRGVVLFQLASRGEALLGDQVGDLSWQVTDDAQTKPVVRAIVQDIT